MARKASALSGRCHVCDARGDVDVGSTLYCGQCGIRHPFEQLQLEASRPPEPRRVAETGRTGSA